MVSEICFERPKLEATPLGYTVRSISGTCCGIPTLVVYSYKGSYSSNDLTVASHTPHVMCHWGVSSQNITNTVEIYGIKWGVP